MSPTLRANMGDNLPGVCYALEGNTVDRASGKNGKGWCEGQSPTLNTQDRHAVVYSLEGNGARPSHMGSGYSDEGVSFTLNITEVHSVCYGIDLQGGKGNAGYCADRSPTLLSDSHGTPNAVCFQLCGDRDNPSVSASDRAYCLPANPMSDRGQAVCFRKACKPGAGGKGERWEESGFCNTLNGFEFHSQVRTPEIVAYIMDSYTSNAMKSPNPQSGFHRAEVSKCLDTECLNPACNQGGVLIVAYAPNGNHCGAFLPTEVSATLELGYHYGSGGDAALILRKSDEG